MITHQHAIADLESLQLDDQTRANYLHGNADRVFNLTMSSPS